MTRVVFMGSPEFAVPSLRALVREFEVVGVVTQPDRPAGRGRQLKPPAVKLAAQQLGLPLIQPSKLRATETMDQLSHWSPELIVVTAFGQILRQELLKLPTHGCINVHASLLPRWRGAAPIQAALLAGDPETGVTIMKMDEGIDTGAILLQRRMPIQTDDTAGSLGDHLAQLGAEVLVEALQAYLSGKLLPVPQADTGETYAPMLRREDGLLKPERPADELERRVRALNPRPGAFLAQAQETLKVHRAHAEPGASLPGQRLVVRGEPAIGTSRGILVLDEVQPPGKKSMSGKSFLAGLRSWAT